MKQPKFVKFEKPLNPPNTPETDSQTQRTNGCLPQERGLGKGEADEGD